jgi:hypothetical protein
MADYLAGLAARALGVETVVRPRPAMRFEPQPGEEPEVARATEARPLEPRRAAAEVPATGPAAQPTSGELPPRVTDVEEALHGAPRVPPSPATPAVEAPERRGARSSTPAPPEARTTSQAAPPPAAARVEPAGERAAALVRPTTRRRTAAPAAPSHVATELPPVRVTIGRIEVRAVTPPAQTPPRPAPRGPAPLSLDDYLEQRRSGRR